MLKLKFGSLWKFMKLTCYSSVSHIYCKNKMVLMAAFVKKDYQKIIILNNFLNY